MLFPANKSCFSEPILCNLFFIKQAPIRLENLIGALNYVMQQFLFFQDLPTIGQ